MYEQRGATNPALNHVSIGVLPNRTLRTGVSQLQSRRCIGSVLCRIQVDG